MQKKRLDEKNKISDFMTSEPVQKKFAVHTLPNISRGKSNQPMKFGKIIKYNKKIIFFRNHAENVAGRLAAVIFLFFKKDLYEVNASDQQPSTCLTIRTNCVKF